jgi:thymidylate synthase ThyX
MRYRFMLNARAAFHFLELRTSPQGHPGYRQIGIKMHQQLAKVHPNLAKAMIFVNKDEDPELTRMAAELATQYKLEKLDNLDPGTTA